MLVEGVDASGDLEESFLAETWWHVSVGVGAGRGRCVGSRVVFSGDRACCEGSLLETEHTLGFLILLIGLLDA